MAKVAPVARTPGRAVRSPTCHFARTPALFTRIPAIVRSDEPVKLILYICGFSSSKFAEQCANLTTTVVPNAHGYSMLAEPLNACILPHPFCPMSFLFVAGYFACNCCCRCCMHHRAADMTPILTHPPISFVMFALKHPQRQRSTLPNTSANSNSTAAEPNTRSLQPPHRCSCRMPDQRSPCHASSSFSEPSSMT